MQANKQSTVWKCSTTKKRPDILLTVWMSERYKACHESSNEVKRERRKSASWTFFLPYFLWIYSLIMSKYLLWQKSFADHLNLRRALILKHETLWRMLMKLEIRKYFSRIVRRRNWNSNNSKIWTKTLFAVADDGIVISNPLLLRASFR